MSAIVGTFRAIEELLVGISPKLGTLKVEDQSSRSTRSTRERLSLRLDARIIDIKMLFPKLSTLYLGLGAIRHVQAIPYILNSSPNLLVFHLEHYQSNDSINTLDQTIAYEPFLTPTKIYDLSISLHSFTPGRDLAIDTTASTLLSILQHCPETRRLTFDYNHSARRLDPGDNALDKMFKAVEAYKELEEFVWKGDPEILHAGSEKLTAITNT